MNERIFVIEDDENIQEIVKLSLESNGYRVTLFDNAIDALEAIHDEDVYKRQGYRPALIISNDDYQLFAL